MRKSFTRLSSVLVLLFLSFQVSLAMPAFPLSELSPEDGACQVPRDGEFVMTFDEDVSPGYDGTISLNNPQGTQYLPIQLRANFETEAGSGVFTNTANMSGDVVTWTVTFDGKTVTIDFGYDLGEFNEWYITVSANAVKNASDEFFPGLGYTSVPSLKCEDDPGVDWDFTTADETAPHVADGGLDPEDEETGVDPAQNLVITFNEDVYWAETEANGNGASFLENGDIALYESYDPLQGVYGGDVIFIKPESAIIDGDSLTIDWSTTENMPSLTEMYVRIKPGIIVDGRGLIFQGFNTNGEAVDTPWNFSTKDGEAPEVTFAMSSCFANSEFTITLDETGIIDANDLTNTNIDNYVGFSGGDFDATIEEVSGETVITIAPDSDLAHETEYTVSLLAGLIDESDNAIAADSDTFTSGDYQVDNLDILTWKNPDGTSFSINLESPEQATYYYVVVRADSVDEGGADKYEPEDAEEIYDIVINNYGTYVSDGKTTATSDDKTIDVYESDSVVAPSETELLAHVTELAQTHGMDYVVYLFGADVSTCGSNSFLPTSSFNVGGVKQVRPSTYDVLPPVATFTADLVDSDDDYDGCSEDGVGADGDGIKRGGAIYISFNEAIEKENGEAILPADIPEIVSLQGAITSNYSVDLAKSYYDADNMQLVVYPSVAFSSGEDVTATVNYNTIQDAADEDRFGPNGNELLSEPSDAFCVEAYIGPIVSFEPCDSSLNVDRDKVIVITIDQYVYAPAVDGDTLTDVLGDDTFVGNYIQMRKYPGLTDAPAGLTGGQIIYSGDDPGTSYFLDNVTFGVEYNSDGETEITITPIAPYEFDSETWYTVALEQALRTEDNLTIWDTENNGDAPADGCAIDNYWTSFRSEDNRPPEVIFYEDDDMLVDDPGVVEPYLDANFDVADTAYILVEIDEWVQLGFDGFQNLEPTEKIEDANALRRYFALNIVNEDETLTPVSFDVKNFTLDAVNDIARFYIDAYYFDRDDPNFTEGLDYQVCFIDNPNELEDYLDDPALTDDNMNALAEACANFTVPAPVEPTECIVSASLNGVELDLTNTDYAEIGLTEDSLFTIEFVFGGAMESVAGPALRIYEEGGAVVTTIDAGEGSPIDANSNRIGYELDLHGTSIADNSNYYIHFDLDSAIVAAGAFDCAYPSTDDFTVAMFTTIDATAPVITSFIPDNPDATPYAACLADKDSTNIIMTWDEDVTLQPGKKLELWRLTGDATLIAYIDVSYNIAEDDNEVIFDKSLFQDLLAYDTQYYIHIPEGFVLNEELIPNEEVTISDSLTFCVGPDPAPEIVCGDFSPVNPVWSPSTNPDLVITFSEPVEPVSGHDLQVYESGTTPVTNAYLSVDVTALTEVAGSNGTEWKLSTNADFSPQSFTEFMMDSCYDVNIEAGAFVEENGTQTTSELITNTIGTTWTQTACTWTFCIGDNVDPTVTFWPETDDKHIATNAHLYAYIDELPVLMGADTIPVNVSNVEDYFNLSRPGNSDVPFDIEFVGSDAPGEDNDKQHIRIVPRDPLGPDWSLTDNNPSMVDATEYTLSFNAGGVVPVSHNMVDVNGNLVEGGSAVTTMFTTEDITAPTYDGIPYVTSQTSSKIEFSAEIYEEGTIRYVIVESGADAVTAVQACVDDDSWKSLGVEAGEAETDEFGVAEFEFTADPGEGEYDYDIYFFAYDDEVDLYDEDSEIEATWPYADATMGFETENYRIKDLRPAPNGCTVEGPLEVSFCDDDTPVLLTGADDETYPTVTSYAIDPETGMPTNVDVIAVEDSIVLEFNEDIQINDTDVTGNKIVLRDYHNNLGVPLAYTVVDNVITLYPLDSNLVVTEADAFQPLTGSSPTISLPQESMYYLEIDRWAISDVDGCNGDNNYFGEWVGKDHLAFATEDNTAPCDVDWAPLSCVDPEADIEITFFEKNEVMVNPDITGDSAYIYIYRVGEIDPHERIPVSLAVKTKVEDEDNQYKFTIPTSYVYLSGERYSVRVPAGLFVDNSGNVWNCHNGASWTFRVRDYEAPIASWTVIQDFSYLDIAIEDPDYDGMIVSGDAGATINEVPTSSLLKVEFNESVFLQDEDNDDTWTNLANTTLVEDEFAAAFTLTENGNVLTWDSDNDHSSSTTTGDYTIQETGTNYVKIRVYHAEDHWAPALTEFEKDFGLKSNSQYVMSLDGGVFSDAENCDDNRNIYDGDDPLVVINTRDDVPPVLSIMDVSGADICENQCVEAGSPLHLQFDSEVVKTPFAGIEYTFGLGWAHDDVNWWSEANLPLLESDLMATMNGDFLRFYETNAAGSTTGDSVLIESVEIDENGMDIYITLAEPLESQAFYYIEFAAGSVKDTKRVPDGNEFMGKDCIFRVKDTEAPYASAFYPADESNPGDFEETNVLKESTWNGADLMDDEMAILFSEPIALVDNSTDSLVIRRMNGQIYATVAADEVYVDEDKLDVLHIPVVSPEDVEGTFEEFTAYYVEVPAGFVTDTTSCDRNGSIVIDPEIEQFEWNFSTSDDTPPMPIVFIPNDTRDEEGNLVEVNDSVSKNSDLTIIFDENIIIDSLLNKGIYIYHHDNTVGWVGDPGEDFGNIVEYVPFYEGSGSTAEFANFDLEAENVYNGLTNNILTVNPTTDFTRTGTYYIRVSGDVIRDAQNNYWDGVGDTITWRFTITNDVAPVLTSTTPEYDHGTNPWEYEVLPAEDYGYVVSDLSMSFVDELNFEPLDVAPGVGAIKVYEYRYDPDSYAMVEKLWKTYDVNDEAVIFEGNTVTIEDVLLRDNINRQFGAYEECYYVMVDRGAITNDFPGSLTYFGGIDNPFVWRFQTGNDEVFVPGYEIMSPNGEDATDLTIEAADSLVVAFNEGIESLGDEALGQIIIRDLDGDSIFASLDVAPESCVDTMLYVNISDILVDEKNYSITVQEGAFGDTSTVSTPNFAFGGDDEWFFHTGDNTPPVPDTTALLAGETCVDSEFDMIMTFDETHGVDIQQGMITFTDNSGENVIEPIPADSLSIDETMNVVTTYVAGLPDTTEITVTLSEGLFIDRDDHSPLENPEVSWSFTTGDNSGPVPTLIEPSATVETSEVEIQIAFDEPVNSTMGYVDVNGIAVLLTTENDTIYSALVSDELLSDQVNVISFTDSSFFDTAICGSNVVDVTTTLEFDVADIESPEATYYPTDEYDGYYMGIELLMLFNDNVSPEAAKYINIYDAEDDELVVSIEADTFTSEDDSTYEAMVDLYYGSFYVLADTGSFVDDEAVAIGQNYNGIVSDTVWTFDVVDSNFGDCVSGLSPERDATGVETSTDITITFCDEDSIRPSSRDEARYVSVANSNESFAYEVADSMITGNTLTFHVEGLNENTEYSVYIQTGAVTDEFGNEWDVKTDANWWPFTTGDFTAPEVTLVAGTAVEGDNAEATMTTTENGDLYLVEEGVAAEVAVMDAAIADNKAVRISAFADDEATVSVSTLVAGNYNAVAVDAEGNVSAKSDNVFVIDEAPNYPVLTIAAIQGDGDESPYADQIVVTSGTVTGVDESGAGFFMQDANEARGGIYVYDEDLAANVGVGTSVKVTATAYEHYTLTQLKDVIAYEFTAKVVEPVAIEITAAEVGEDYEGVLVKVDSLKTTKLPSEESHGEWYTADTENDVDVTIDEQLFTFVPDAGQRYNITGVCNYTYEEYKLAPRNLEDIEIVTGIKMLDINIDIYPNPFDTYVKFDVSHDVEITKAVITNIAGQLVKQVDYPENTIRTDELRSGVYFISLQTEEGIAKTERIIKR